MEKGLIRPIQKISPAQILVFGHVMNQVGKINPAQLLLQITDCECEFSLKYQNLIGTCIGIF